MYFQGKVTKLITHPFNDLEHYNETAKNRLLGYLKGLPKDKMIARINELRLSEKNLNLLCFGIALQAEEYEICAAVQAILKEGNIVN